SAAAGTYVENINFNGKNIAVIGEDRETTIIDGNQNGSVVTFGNGEDSTAVLGGFTIQNGVASHGGGIHCLSSNPRLEDLTVKGNTASGGEYNQGGGIYCYDSSPRLNNVSITDNSALAPIGDGGGIICNTTSNPILKNVTIIDNSSTDDGGGMACFSSSNPILNHVTIANNSASWGGGINCRVSSDPILMNVTISGNTASGGLSDENGGAIYLHNNSNPNLVNTILWNNSPNELEFAANNVSSSISISFSNIGGGQDSIITNDNGTITWGDGNIDVDPVFVDTANGDYHLLASSQLINAGHPDSTDSDGTIADIGAYPYLNSYSGP
ncbi:uncharacterized protein METZ01_LOCUS344696, partial [marine metagenome]